MRFLTLGAAILAGVTQASPTPQTSETDLAKRATYVTTSGTHFNIDGSTGYFAGTNFYPLAFLTSNADVDLVFTQLAASGLKVLRIWGFNDITSSTSSVWFQSFISGASPVINTGTNGLQRMDYVVSSAASHGVKLVINFVNNWSDYGGMAAYNSYYGTSASPDLWYTNAKVQAQYQAYIKAVVSRYTTSTAIFAWELANEVRCTGCATSVITNWVKTTSAYIKTLDSNHLVTLGDEGFMNGGGDGSYPYTTGPGVDWAANLAVSSIDYGTFHLYPSSWGETNDWGDSWITNHAAVCVTKNKPCVLEEYGASSSHTTVEAPWQATSLGAAGMAGDQFWQFGTTLSSGKTADDGNTIFYGTNDWTVLVTEHVSAVNAKNGGGGGSTSTSTKATTTTAKATTTSTGSTSTSTAGTVPKYGQCGGSTYTGSTVCAAGSTCTYSNPYYSQCL